MHFSSVKFNETIIFKQINAIFLLLLVIYIDIFHTVKIGRLKTSINLLEILNVLFE